MLRMPVSLDIRKLEELIEDSLNPDTKSPQLEIPINTNQIAFGGYAAAVQAINTWFYANSESSTLKLKSSEEIEDLIREPHKFTAFLMAKKFDDGISDDVELKKKIYGLAENQVDNQSKSKFGQSKGRLCWFTFVDHSTKGFDRNFYINAANKRPQIRNEEQISNIITSMVKQSSRVAGGGVLPPECDVSDLGRVFNELFHNSHEHGSRAESKNVWLKPATRVLYTYGINLSDESVTNKTEREVWLANYLTKLNEKGLSTQHFVEIGVVDSGLGFCGRWMADNGSDEEFIEQDEKLQYSILKRCFEFRKTSTGKSNKGHGLTAVMEHLTKLNGFIRIRSNQLAVFRDFASEPFSIKKTNYEFFDWVTKKPCNESISLLPEARGVSITLLVPLYAKQQREESGND